MVLIPPSHMAKWTVQYQTPAILSQIENDKFKEKVDKFIYHFVDIGSV